MTRTIKKVNEHNPITEKTEYCFTRPKSAKPVFEDDNIFRDYAAELDQIGYTGNMILKSHVDSSGLLKKPKLLKSSGVDRVDEIALKVLNLMYITPACKNHQKLADYS